MGFNAKNAEAIAKGPQRKAFCVARRKPLRSLRLINFSSYQANCSGKLKAPES